MTRLWFYAIACTVSAVVLVSITLVGLFFPGYIGTGRILLFLPITLLASVRSVQLLRAIQRKDTTWRPSGPAQHRSAAWMLVAFGVGGLIISLIVKQPDLFAWRIFFGALSLTGFGMLVFIAARRRRVR